MACPRSHYNLLPQCHSRCGCPGAVDPILIHPDPKQAAIWGRGLLGRCISTGDCHRCPFQGPGLHQDTFLAVQDTCPAQPEPLLSLQLPQLPGNVPLLSHPIPAPGQPPDPFIPGAAISMLQHSPPSWLGFARSCLLPFPSLLALLSCPPVPLVSSRLGSPWVSRSHTLRPLFSPPPNFSKEQLEPHASPLQGPLLTVHPGLLTGALCLIQTHYVAAPRCAPWIPAPLPLGSS